MYVYQLNVIRNGVCYKLYNVYTNVLTIVNTKIATAKLFTIKQRKKKQNRNTVYK